MIDEDELARQTAGDTDLQLELLTLFHAQLVSLNEQVQAATAALDRMSLANLPAVLHRVRGAASAVGARDLATRLGLAEDALTAQPGSQAVLDDLLTHLAAASTTLASLIATRESAGLAKAWESR